MIYGIVGFGGSLVLSVIILINIYAKVGSCLASCNADGLIWQTYLSAIAYALGFGSIVVVELGLLMMVMVYIAAQARQPRAKAAKDHKKLKYLMLRILASGVAFFVSTSILIVIVSQLVAMVSPGSVDQQSQIFAYVIVFSYPLVGGFSAYCTYMFLKERLGY